MYYFKTILEKKLAFFVTALSLCFGSSSLSADFPTDPHIVIDSSGNEVAVWEVDGDTGSTIHSAFFDAATSTWSTEAAISGSDNAFNARVVFNAAGQVVVAWFVLDTVDSVYNIKTVKYDPTTNTWSSPVIITVTTEDAAQFDLRVNSNGDTSVLWTSYDTTDLTYKTWVSTSSFSGSWSTPARLF